MIRVNYVPISDPEVTLAMHDMDNCCIKGTSDCLKTSLAFQKNEEMSVLVN